MKKKWWLLAAALAVLLVCWIGGTVWRGSRAGILREIQQHLPEMEAQALICLEDPENAAEVHGWCPEYDARDGIVVFPVSYTGFGSRSDQRGVYYAPDGEPAARGCTEGREELADGVKFLGEGDNYCISQPIAPNWFWFEQHW